MAFKFGASIVSQIPGKKTGQSWALYESLKSVGIWPGVELKASGESPDGTLLGIMSRFQSLAKAHPKQKKPLTFSWEPTKEDKNLFKSILRHRSFYMIVGITDENSNFLRFEFEDVKLMRTPVRKSGVEQIEATFLDFYKHP
jgi:hypothetical protein